MTMELRKGIERYLSALKFEGSESHQEMALAILMRFAEWSESSRGDQSRLTLSELTTKDISDFLDFRGSQRGLREGTRVSCSTLAKEIRYIRAFIGHAFTNRREFEIHKNARAPEVPFVRQPAVVSKALKREDLATAFAACQHAKYPIIPGITPGEWWTTLLYLAYTTSLPRRVLFKLPRPAEEELNAGLLRIPGQGDRKPEKYVVLTPLACELLAKLPSAEGGLLFVWTSKLGGHDFRSFYHEFERMQIKAGIVGTPQARLQTLRSTPLIHLAEHAMK